MMQGDKDLEKVLSGIFNKEVEIKSVEHLSGGCINNALKIETGNGSYFVKWNYRSDMFEKEVAGLKLLKSSDSVCIPEVLGTFSNENTSYLILSFITPGKRISNFEEILGRKLAKMHKCSNAFFGLEYDNYIGYLSQKNNKDTSWVDFYINQRLEVQLKLAESAGKASFGLRRRFENLYKKLPDILVSEPPSLLHGDLWSGNVMVNDLGEATLIDPAVYFGHREVDLAMTKLFGGFGSTFYKAYFEAWPVEKGIEERLEIYTLYPLLVHVNLFGGGYLSSVETIIGRYS